MDEVTAMNSKGEQRIEPCSASAALWPSTPRKSPGGSFSHNRVLALALLVALVLELVAALVTGGARLGPMSKVPFSEACNTPNSPKGAPSAQRDARIP